MKLGIDSKNELRLLIEKKLADVPEGVRIKLDDKLLEELIFLPVTMNETFETVKLPVWTGDFLKKIDLSRLSFENVYFVNNYSALRDEIYAFDSVEKEAVVKDENGKTVHDYFDDYIIFSGTNINLDFSKVYGSQIESLLLNGVDLTKSELGSISVFSACDFSNTNLNVNFNDTAAKFYQVNFSGNDFSKNSIDSIYFDRSLFDCNFTNTGLNIEFNCPSIPGNVLEALIKLDELDHAYISDEIDQNKYRMLRMPLEAIISKYTDVINYASNFDKVEDLDLISGCTINGEPYSEELVSNIGLSAMKREYLSYKQQIFSNIQNSFDNQLGTSR